MNDVEGQLGKAILLAYRVGREVLRVTKETPSSTGRGKNALVPNREVESIQNIVLACILLLLLMSCSFENILFLYVLL